MKHDKDGRLIITLPLKDSIKQLNDNKQNAFRRFYTLEDKFKKQPEFKKLYVDFIHDYKHLGHMSISNPDIKAKEYFLPHHGIIKESSTTTKLYSMPHPRQWKIYPLMILNT